MIIPAKTAFSKMDTLSLSGQPFFFMVDFMVEKVIILEEKNIENSQIAFSFPNQTFNNQYQSTLPTFHFSAFPEAEHQYEKGFHHIQKHLRLGNSYLANYTCKTPIETSWSLDEIFSQTTAKYKILFQNEFVCFSPETFIEIKDNIITTHPMKGTIDASLPNAKEQLRTDEKEKAEHFTVVDLLRNDLSQVAKQVRVKAFQRIDKIHTHSGELLGMSSEIEGVIRTEYQQKVGSILERLLPAGSILGAPKLKTLEIILQSETFPRKWYTGVAGFFDGKNLDSCVMIRFIEEEKGRLYFRSGGGITHKSTMKDEYEEMKKKIYIPHTN